MFYIQPSATGVLIFQEMSVGALFLQSFHILTEAHYSGEYYIRPTRNMHTFFTLTRQEGK